MTRLEVVGSRGVVVQVTVAACPPVVVSDHAEDGVAITARSHVVLVAVAVARHLAAVSIHVDDGQVRDHAELVVSTA